MGWFIEVSTFARQWIIKRLIAIYPPAIRASRCSRGSYAFRVRCANTGMPEGGRFNYHMLQVEIALFLGYVDYRVGRYERNSPGRRVPLAAVAVIPELAKYERDKASLRARMKSWNWPGGNPG